MVVPVNCRRRVRIEPHLHHDGPDVDSQVEDDYSEKTELSPSALAEPLDIEDEPESEAADTFALSALPYLGARCRIGKTHMQKKGEMSEDRARVRTEK